MGLPLPWAPLIPPHKYLTTLPFVAIILPFNQMGRRQVGQRQGEYLARSSSSRGKMVLATPSHGSPRRGTLLEKLQPLSGHTDGAVGLVKNAEGSTKILREFPLNLKRQNPNKRQGSLPDSVGTLPAKEPIRFASQGPRPCEADHDALLGLSAPL